MNDAEDRHFRPQRRREGRCRDRASIGGRRGLIVQIVIAASAGSGGIVTSETQTQLFIHGVYLYPSSQTPKNKETTSYS